MRKILIFFFVLTVIFTPVAVTQAGVFPTLVPNCNKAVDGQIGFDGEECGWKHIVKLAQNIVDFLIAFSVVIATLMFTYAGFLYLTAGGNPSQLEKAHKIFINVGIGFVFVLGAFLIVKLVTDTFGTKDSTTALKRDLSTVSTSPSKRSSSSRFPSTYNTSNTSAQDLSTVAKDNFKQVDIDTNERVAKDNSGQINTNEQIVDLKKIYGDRLVDVFISHQESFRNSPPADPLEALNKIAEGEDLNSHSLQDITFQGLENTDGLSEDDILSEVKNIYSEKYLRNTLSKVIFSSQDKTGAPGAPDTAGEVIGNLDGAEMVIYDTVDMNLDEFMDIFKHEIHHTNDWNTSTSLTLSERIDMLYDVTQRVSSDDRFHSSYVEGITPSEAVYRHSGVASLFSDITDEQRLTYVKSNEYWAEIGAAYFDNPSNFKKTNPKDAAIVEKWVEKTID